tara:strand:- start:445 stop:1101 length:657 start_codon:yes stop_codon:yes gene_type:complete
MKKLFFFFAPIVFILLVLFIYLYTDSFVSQFLRFIEQNRNNHLLIFFINIIYCLSSLPVTPLIIANGFFLGLIGFTNIFLAIIFSSIIIFTISSLYCKKLEKKNFFKKIIIRNTVIKKFRYNSDKSFIFLILRYILPFYVHNLFYGISKISFLRFTLLVGLSEIPLTYAFFMIGQSLKEFSYKNLDFLSIILSKNFLFPLFFILIFMILINFLRKKFS